MKPLSSISRFALCLLTLSMPAFNTVGQSTQKAIINFGHNAHHAVNYRYFRDRAPTNWVCYLAGTGGDVGGDFGTEYDVPGLDWTPSTGADMIRRAATNGFEIVMYYRAGLTDLNSLVDAYAAATNGCAVFTPHASNCKCFFDFRSPYGPIYGRGPAPAMIVSGGSSGANGSPSQNDSSHGTQGEFTDARDDFGNDEQSFAHSATAARYAKIKNLTGWTNVFDIRQALRQTCTFYEDGWREDGGYGFPLVSNRVGNSFSDTTINGKSLNNLTLNDIDVGPPIQPSADISSCGTNVTFRWYNYRQTGFESTIIKIDGETIYEGDGSSYDWTPTKSGTVTADFITKLTNDRLSRNAINPELESYARIVLNHMQTNACGSCPIVEFDLITDSNNVFTVLGPPGTFWQLHQSSNLVHWVLSGGVTLGSNPVSFTNDNLTGVTHRFYRASNGECCSKIIGFTRVTVEPGEWKLIANQLDSPEGNTLSGLFNPMADGAIPPSEMKIFKWNGSSFVEKTAWGSDSTTSLDPGEGAFIYNPTTNAITLTFGGHVRDGNLVLPVSSGEQVLSAMIPQGGGLTSQLSFTPSDGDFVYIWNGTSYDVYEYYNPGGWDPDEPVLQIGQSFRFVSGDTNNWIRDFNPCSGQTFCTVPTLVGLFDQDDFGTFTLHAPVGTPWRVDYSSDLVEWSLAAQVTVSVLGPAYFGDTQMQGVQRRFYRASNGECCSKIIGFTRVTVEPGEWKLVANQLDSPEGNTLSGLFNPMADGTIPPNEMKIYKWNGSAFVEKTSWGSDSTTSLDPGEGAFIYNPTTNAITLTFGGHVRDGNLVLPVSSGEHVLSSMVPQAGGLTSQLSFTPNDGDFVYIWNGTSYDVYEYYYPGNWDPDEPEVEIGQSFRFISGATNNWFREFSLPCE
ncbi:MAG: hypothetical protein IH623_22300 [Verrucomicrobia bacterium]|nr:hypothetical protein [Verrucomicrobiota bacterium]